MSERGIDIEWLGGNCPVMAEGTFDGKPFCFRARGTQVTVDVGEWEWRGPEYEWPHAGWISEDLARAFITAAYDAWIDRENPRGKPAGYYRRLNGLNEQARSALAWAGRLQKAVGQKADPAVAWLQEHAAGLMAKSRKHPEDSTGAEPTGPTVTTPPEEARRLAHEDRAEQ